MGQTYSGEITNLEEQALSMVGKDVYEKLIKGYTEKQWNRPCDELPSSIIKRIPVRFTWDSNYFNDKFVGMPVGGYTQIFEKMLEGCDVMLNTNYFNDQLSFDLMAETTIYTGPIDTFFGYKYGKLEYRSLNWVTKKLEQDNFQGVPVMNYTDIETPFTRIIEHKHFDNNKSDVSWVSWEYPVEYNSKNTEPYYPVNDLHNNQIYQKYKNLSNNLPNIIFGGRLAEYKYYDMHQVIESALNKVKEELDLLNDSR
jgi:UDP-galactopyranose mutase